MAPKPPERRGAATTLLFPGDKAPPAPASDRRRNPGPADGDFDGGGFPDPLVASLAKGRKDIPFGYQVTEDGRVLKPAGMQGLSLRPSFSGRGEVERWVPVSGQEKQAFVEKWIGSDSYRRRVGSPEEEEGRINVALGVDARLKMPKIKARAGQDILLKRALRVARPLIERGREKSIRRPAVSPCVTIIL